MRIEEIWCWNCGRFSFVEFGNEVCPRCESFGTNILEGRRKETV